MRKSTSGFRFGDFSYLRRSKAICIPNFYKISQSTIEILLLPILKTNGCHIEVLVPDFRFDSVVFIVIGMWFCVGMPNLIWIGSSVTELWRLSNFQDDGYQPCWIFVGVIADHPRSVIDSRCFILKFRLDRFYSAILARDAFIERIVALLPWCSSVCLRRACIVIIRCILARI